MEFMALVDVEGTPAGDGALPHLPGMSARGWPARQENTVACLV
ncbi:hypothetical protein [Polaromonas sp. CG9_12]|nr:hypothetical protein [Polaromonas sp. CG9_12]